MESADPKAAPWQTSLQVVFAVIVIAQFCGTSLWFAGNAIVTTLAATHDWPSGSTAYITTAVQAGFILGTMLVTLTGLADRISPSRLFFFSCLAGAVVNGLPAINLSSFSLNISSRVMTGIALGGIYPIGMKIAADWREKGLGDWLGALVGALVLGTALPHALRTSNVLQHPGTLLMTISGVAVFGGVLLFLLVPDGPFRKPSHRFNLSHIARVLKFPKFRAPLFGYFGHMWELYTLWALIPWIITRYFRMNGINENNISIFSFLIIAAGGIGCWAGGKISRKTGSHYVARTALFLSCLCCLMSPWLWQMEFPFFLVFLVIWGLTVVTDSPQFSALVALHAPAEARGTALTLATCVGFSITIISIQFLTIAQTIIPEDYILLLLAPGPILGLWFGRFPK